jgi:hypothetical protein
VFVWGQFFQHAGLTRTELTVTTTLSFEINQNTDEAIWGDTAQEWRLQAGCVATRVWI